MEVSDWEHKLGKKAILAGRAKDKRGTRERITKFKQAGGRVEVLDWSDLKRKRSGGRRVWREGSEHARGQLGQETRLVKEVIRQVLEFKERYKEEGERSLGVAACKYFLEGSHGKWPYQLLVARTKNGRVQGVALARRENSYLNTLIALAARGEVRGTGSALLARVAQMTLEKEGMRVTKAVGEFMEGKGWKDGGLEVEANRQGESYYLQMGGVRGEQGSWHRHHVFLAGGALKFLAEQI